MPRNASGTYTLPAGNPVVTGTVIASTWANTTLDDLRAEMTDSLSRSSKGGMLAPLLLVDGTVGIPGLAFVTEPATGLYRPAANELGLTRAGTAMARLTGAAAAPAWTLSSPQAAGGTQTDFFFHVTTPATSRALFGIRNGPTDRFVVTTSNIQTANNIQFTGSGGDTISQIGTNAGLIFKGNRSAADTGDDIVVNSTATRTAGNLLNVQNNSSSQWSVGFDGRVQQAGGIAGTNSLFNILTTGANGRLNLQGNKTAGDAGTDVSVNSTATRTAGALFAVQNNGTDRFRVDFNGALLGSPPGTEWPIINQASNGFVSIRGNRDAGDSGADVVLRSSNTRTSGLLLDIQNNGTSYVGVDFIGGIKARLSNAGLTLRGNLAAATGSGADILLDTSVARTNGNLLAVRNNGADKMRVSVAGVVDAPNVMQVSEITSDNAVTGTTMQSVSGLSFSASANADYYAVFSLLANTSATAIHSVQFTGPASPTKVRFGGQGIFGTTVSGFGAAAFSTPFQIQPANITTESVVLVYVFLRNGANAGTVQLQHATNLAGQTATIFAASNVRWMRVDNAGLA